MRRKNILEYLEATAARVPDKLAYSDGKAGLTFGEVSSAARHIGFGLYRAGIYREPVLIYMKKSPQSVAAFFGCVCARDYYVPVDEAMPEYRLRQIMETSGSRAVICDKTCRKKLDLMGYDGMIFDYETLASGAFSPVSGSDVSADMSEDETLSEIRGNSLDIDPIYIVFTSGSTGTPKGVAACHRSVIDYVEALSESLGFNEDTVFGNQSPFYFDACLKELYPTIMFGAVTYIIPKSLFMFPVRLVEFINEHHINTVCWVVSALTMISSVGTFDVVRPESLKTVAFGSEVFPIRQYRMWREALPEARFFNLYGPTECTGMSCVYPVPEDREFADDEAIPIGKPFDNTEIMLLDDNDRPSEQGEIVIGGTCVTLGYYNNPERTAEVFVQNPTVSAYPQLVYRTGDIGRWDENGDLVFISRKDYQIKHMGHRIELGEIEAHANALDSVYMSACVYDSDRSLIVFFYTGEADESEVIKHLRGRLPAYMIPNKVVRLETMPYTDNGKINRRVLAEKL